MLLKNQWVNDEIKEEIKKYLETNNKIQLYKIYKDATKAVLRVKFLVIQSFLKKRVYQINNLTYHLKELEKEEQTTCKVIRRKEIIKSGEEIK